jgi:hypothetical protein
MMPLVIRPALRIQSCKAFLVGEEVMEMGHSPKPKTETMTNCPGL